MARVDEVTAIGGNVEASEDLIDGSRGMPVWWLAMPCCSWDLQGQ